MKMTDIPIGTLGTVTKALSKRPVDLEITERVRDNPDYSIIEIGPNTKKSPGCHSDSTESLNE